MGIDFIIINMGNSNMPQSSISKTHKTYDPNVHKLHMNYSRPLERDIKGFILSDCDSFTRASMSYVNKFEMSPPINQSDDLDISNSSIEIDYASVLDDCLDIARIHDEVNSLNSDLLEKNRLSTASLETTASVNSEFHAKSKKHLQNKIKNFNKKSVRSEQSNHDDLNKENNRGKLKNKRILYVVKNAIHSLAAPPKWLEHKFTYYN